MTDREKLRRVYPEIHRGRDVPDSSGRVRKTPKTPLAFPDTCPECGSLKTDEIVTGFSSDRGCHYECGGGYRRKPQIQNHTDVWWGSCKA